MRILKEESNNMHKKGEKKRKCGRDHYINLIKEQIFI